MAWICTYWLSWLYGEQEEEAIAAAHDQMGKIARDLGLWADAKEYFEKARAWCEGDEVDLDLSMLMNILGNLGWIEFNLGNYERGKELCERSLAFFRRIGGRGYSITAPTGYH